MNSVILWHRRDLRIHDNCALEEANKNYGTNVYPVFIIDPFFFRENKETNDDRIEFMFECLEDLDNQYKAIGSSLTILYGNSIEVLKNIQEKYNAMIYFNYDTNMNFGFQRDNSVLKKLNSKGFNNDAIIRNGRPDNWHVLCKNYFEKEECTIPEKLNENQIYSTTTINEIRQYFSITKEKSNVQNGGTSQGLKRLEEFKKTLPFYTKSISKPFEAENYTSRLSEYFSFGALSLRRVYQEINSSGRKQKNFFQTRLFWNQHFTQKLNDCPELLYQAANPYFEKHYDEMYKYDEEKIEAWKHGKTGYPLVDASMRALVQTGFLNFRMRAMVASFFTYILKQHWKIGADFMHYHLIDADAAINYTQWQMQSGVIGVHPNRIYNPTKQIEDNDPDCKFIKRYVSELNQTSNSFIKTDPEKRIPTLTNETYIQPVVKFSEEARSAREIYSRLNKQAKIYLENNPEIKKKLSLSQRAKKREIPETKEI